jgi:hypothetical protein
MWFGLPFTLRYMRDYAVRTIRGGPLLTTRSLRYSINKRVAPFLTSIQSSSVRVNSMLTVKESCRCWRNLTETLSKYIGHWPTPVRPSDIQH